MANKDFNSANKVIFDLLAGDDESICDTLEKMIDDELIKPDDQIDFDFIDDCGKAIHTLHGEDIPENQEAGKSIYLFSHKQKSSKVNGRIKRFALIASVVLAIGIAGNSLSVFAFHVNVFGSFVQWTQDKVVFNWSSEGSNSNTTSNSIEQNNQSLNIQLKDNNISDIMLPDIKIYQTQKIKIRTIDHTIEVSFTLKKDKDYINYFITRFSDKAKMDSETILGQYSSGEKFEANGTEFYILVGSENTRVLFRKQLTEYLLSTTYNKETIKKVLETIK